MTAILLFVAALLIGLVILALAVGLFGVLFGDDEGGLVLVCCALFAAYHIGDYIIEWIKAT